MQIQNGVNYILRFSLKLKYSIAKSSVRVDWKDKRGIKLNELTLKHYYN